MTLTQNMWKLDWIETKQKLNMWLKQKNKNKKR